MPSTVIEKWTWAPAMCLFSSQLWLSQGASVWIYNCSMSWSCFQFNHMKNTKMREKIWGLFSPEVLQWHLSRHSWCVCYGMKIGQGNLWAECSACSLGFLCALFSSSCLSPRDVQQSTLCGLQTESDYFAWEVLSFIPGKKWAWRRREFLWWWVGTVWQLCCCSSASQDGAGGFWKLWSCWSNHSTEPFLPGRWEQSTVGLLKQCGLGE